MNSEHELGADATHVGATDSEEAFDPVPLTHDTLFGARLRLAQPARGHRAGTDAVLLAAAAPPVKGLVIDVGAGVGTIGLAIALRDMPARVLLVERDPVFAQLARRNADTNGLRDSAAVIETDVLAALPRRSAGLRNDSADLVVTNPPFYEAARSRPSPHRLRRDAHAMAGDVTEWLRACLALVRPGGTLSLIHRADAIDDVLAALKGRAGAVRVRPVHPRVGVSATRVLVRAVKGSRAPLEILPALVVHEASGEFTPEAAALHEGCCLDHA